MEPGSLWNFARDLGVHQKSTTTTTDLSTPFETSSDFPILYFDDEMTVDGNFTNGTIGARVTSRLAPYPEWLVIVLWLLTTIFSIETILGNLLVLLAYKLERSIRRQLSNKFIVSLAVTDLIIGMEGFPLLTVYVVGRERWPLGQTLCQIWLCLDYTLCLVSILTVLLITVDRYGSVCYPAKYRTWQTNTRVRVFVVFSWIVPCLFFGIMIFAWDPLTGNRMDDSGKCYAPFLNDPYVNMSMYIVYYWTTLVAVSVLYRGIHTAAKTLEDKSKARERQTIALLLGQRCMAQVGVGMLFHSSVSEGHDIHQAHELTYFPRGGAGGSGGVGGGPGGDRGDMGHDSGYMTTTATATTHTNTSGGTLATVYGYEHSRGSLAGKTEFENLNVPIIITQSPPTSVSLSSDHRLSPQPTTPPEKAKNRRASEDEMIRIEAEIVPLVDQAPIAGAASDSSASTSYASPIKALYTAQMARRQRPSLPVLTAQQARATPATLHSLGSSPKKMLSRQNATFEEPQPGQRSQSLVEYRRRSSLYRRKPSKKNRLIHQDSGCSLEFYDDVSTRTSMSSLYGDTSLHSVLEFGALLSTLDSAEHDDSSTITSGGSIFDKNRGHYARNKKSWTTNLNEIFRNKKMETSSKSQENGDLMRTASVTSSSSTWTRSASTSLRSQYSMPMEPEDQYFGGNSTSTTSSPGHSRLVAARTMSLVGGASSVPASNFKRGATSLRLKNGGNLKRGRIEPREISIAMEENLDLLSQSIDLKSSLDVEEVEEIEQNQEPEPAEQGPKQLLQIIVEPEPIVPKETFLPEPYLPPIIEEEKSTTTRTDADLVSRRSSFAPSTIGSPPVPKSGAKENNKVVHLAVPSPAPPGFANAGFGSRKSSGASTIASPRGRRKSERDWQRSSWQSLTSSIYHVGRRQTRRGTRAVDDDDDSDGREPGSSADDSNSDRKRNSSWFATLFNNPASILHRKRKVTKAEKRARKAFRTITVIVGTFALFWSPYYIVATIYGFCQDCVPAPLFLTSYYLCYLNSSVNPFAYAFANRLFRKTFIRILKGDLRRT